MKQLFNVSIKLLAIGALLLSTAAVALATNTPSSNEPLGTFTIYPTYFHNDNKSWIIQNANPGTTISESVTIENLTNEPQTITLNFHEATMEGENFLPIDNQPFKNLGLWTTLERKTHQLNPFEKKQIPVTMVIPQDAQTQTYLGTILASTTTSNNKLNLVTRIGVRVYLNVSNTPSHQGQTNILGLQTPHFTFFFLLSFIAVISSLFYTFTSSHEKK